MKFKLTIAYDGASYAGWQVQKTGVGVQQRVEEAIAKIFSGATRLHSSSRTDAGVHALGMVAQVEIPDDQIKMPAGKIAVAVNAHLPRDIRVMAASRCRADFDARFDAKGKQYRYLVWNGPAMNPLLRHQAWHIGRPLDLVAMRDAAKLFLGKHDFKSLAATRAYEMKSTVRTLRRCDIRRNGPLLTFIIEGDGFLYKMCRGIVGTLAQAGEGKIAPGEIKNIVAPDLGCYQSSHLARRQKRSFNSYPHPGPKGSLTAERRNQGIDEKAAAASIPDRAMSKGRAHKSNGSV